MELGSFAPPSRAQAPSSEPPRYPSIKVHHGRGIFYVGTDRAGGLGMGDGLLFIGLGLLRERTMWPLDDAKTLSRRPLCRSDDAITGRPQRDFPWADYENPVAAPNGALVKSDEIPCDGCNFRKWSNRVQPRCSQTWIIPALIVHANSGAVFNPNQVALLHFSGSGISEMEPFLKPFRDKGIPLYTQITQVTLQRVSKGGRNYSVPKFSDYTQTEAGEHGRYSYLLRQVREYMKPEARQPKLIALDLNQGIASP